MQVGSGGVCGHVPVGGPLAQAAYLLLLRGPHVGHSLGHVSEGHGLLTAQKVGHQLGYAAGAAKLWRELGVHNLDIVTHAHALPGAPELNEVDHVGLIRHARLLVLVQVGAGLAEKDCRVLAVAVLVLAKDVGEPALAVRSAPGLERGGVLDVVLAVVDVAERQLAAVAARVGLDALAVAVAGGDGAVVLGAPDAHEVFGVGEAAVGGGLAAMLADAHLARGHSLSAHLDDGLKLAAALKDVV